MNPLKVIGIFAFILFIAMGTVFVFAEEAVVLSPNEVVPASTLGSPEKMEENVQWIWGEVTNLDTQTKTFTLKYLDYENDQEKELVLVVEESTVYENIKNFDELKLKDTLSVDYKVASDGKNLAKNISLEKPDVISADAQDAVVGDAQLSAPTQIVAPVMEQPIVQPETVTGTSAAVSEVSGPATATAQ